jgi:hypothetical protein
MYKSPGLRKQPNAGIGGAHAMKQTFQLTDEKQAQQRVRSNDLLGSPLNVTTQATLAISLLS